MVPCIHHASSLDLFVATATQAIQNNGLQDTFHIINLRVAEQLHSIWTKLLPNVYPYYAVKCNSDLKLLACLAALGTGFDCASQQELQQVLALGVPHERILYAHTCKPMAQLQFAAAQGVQWTTFDSRTELHKLASLHPRCKALLRIRCDDPQASICLGEKYGAELGEVPALLKAAQKLGVQVAGVAFHVGSGASDPSAFEAAIAAARSVCDQATALGFNMEVLDIGGGFSGGFSGSFKHMAEAIQVALHTYFPAGCGVRVIAEPGRFFAEPVQAVAVVVNGIRERKGCREYFVSDGIYGAFSILLYEKVTLTPLCLRAAGHGQPDVQEVPDAEEGPAVVWGPTCCSLDKVLANVQLPHMEVGDWLLFPNMGAYTLASSTRFNGFNSGAHVTYILQDAC